jgi:spore germination protein GerM
MWEMSDTNTNKRESRKWHLYSQPSDDAGSLRNLVRCGDDGGYSQERELTAAVRKLARGPENSGLVFVALKEIRFVSRTKVTTVVEVS